MSKTDEIMEQACTLFNAAGVVAEENSTVLILGLESTQERDLDRMALRDGKMRFYGWNEHVKPRMMALMDLIRERGFEAEPVSWWDYPRGDVMQLKHLAVVAGLGQQGKSTLLLNPTFGHRLRLAGMRTRAPLTPTGTGTYQYQENPLCQSCNICIDACPVEGLLQPYQLLDLKRCLANIEDNLAQEGRERLGWCHEACRTKCPVG